MKTVAIVGVGLIGGSFALALRKAGFAGEITGVSSARAIESGIRTGAISRGTTLEEAAASADLIYLAQTVDRILETIETLGPMLRPGCLVTDAGSTKAAIVDQAQRFMGDGQFLGGHPMAGKEQRGAEAADPSLFENRPYLLTPVYKETARTAEFRDWLARLGANVIEMSADEHDETVALTSHLPQVVSTALAATLARHDNPYLNQVFGRGLLDMTRLALSDIEIWRGILASNEANVKSGLDALIASLTEVRNSIGTEEMGEIFSEGSRFSTSLRNLPSTS
ncbi:MAG: prephenate dehydrogenase/arogenate dehydrogenase family protein [Acidobacteriaceae bacterium]|nr:prephenate dehydrogenase/arogenate dehydrogenase family protein [Acidobacteriaceae bacterium]